MLQNFYIINIPVSNNNAKVTINAIVTINLNNVVAFNWQSYSFNSLRAVAIKQLYTPQRKIKFTFRKDADK